MLGYTPPRASHGRIAPSACRSASCSSVSRRQASSWRVSAPRPCRPRRQRTLLVTLVGGAQVTVTVDVPPGTPTDQIPIPGVSAPIVGVQDITPAPAHADPRADAAAGPAGDPDGGRAAAPGAVASSPPRPRTTAARAPRRTTRPSRPPSRKPSSGLGRCHRRSRQGQAPVEAAEGQGDPAEGQGRGRQGEGRRRAAQPDGTPTLGNPTLLAGAPGPGADRRARTSSSTSSASRRSCCRSTRPPASSTASAGRSWPRSTRSRPTTAATSTSPPPAPSAGCSSCPSTWKHVRRRRQPRRPQGPVQPGRRDLRRRALPEGRRRRHRTCARAIFAYNHADWYVDSVLLRARLIGGLPADLVGSLTGLTQGHFPVARQGHLRRRPLRRADRQEAVSKGTTPRCRSSRRARRRGINIFAKAGAPVDRRQRRQDRQDRHAPSASAASSSCRTSTATRTRTRT